jgi:hypothetical protein
LEGSSLAIDQGYAAAHVLIAFTHVLDYVNAWTSDPENSLWTGLELAKEAVGRDEEESAAHFALGADWGAGSSTARRQRRDMVSPFRPTPWFSC